MGKCYCDYCDVFLTHDSVAVRKQHNDGNRHKQNVCDYYRQFIGQKTQRRIDEIVAEFERKVLFGLVRPSFGFPSLNGATPVRDDNPPPAAPNAASAPPGAPNPAAAPSAEQAAPGASTAAAAEVQYAGVGATASDANANGVFDAPPATGGGGDAGQSLLSPVKTFEVTAE